MAPLHRLHKIKELHWKYSLLIIIAVLYILAGLVLNTVQILFDCTAFEFRKAMSIRREGMGQMHIKTINKLPDWCLLGSNFGKTFYGYSEICGFEDSKFYYIGGIDRSDSITIIDKLDKTKLRKVMCTKTPHMFGLGRIPVIVSFLKGKVPLFPWTGHRLLYGIR